jgi:hypothetical protein
MEEADLFDRVCPTGTDARSLPYAETFFEAAIGVDAHTYSGADDPYLDDLHEFARPKGQIGIAVPGFGQDSDGPLTEHLKPSGRRKHGSGMQWEDAAGCGATRGRSRSCAPKVSLWLESLAPMEGGPPGSR